MTWLVTNSHFFRPLGSSMNRALGLLGAPRTGGHLRGVRNFPGSQGRVATSSERRQKRVEGLKLLWVRCLQLGRTGLAKRLTSGQRRQRPLRMTIVRAIHGRLIMGMLAYEIASDAAHHHVGNGTISSRTLGFQV